MISRPRSHQRSSTKRICKFPPFRFLDSWVQDSPKKPLIKAIPGWTKTHTQTSPQKMGPGQPRPHGRVSHARRSDERRRVASSWRFWMTPLVPQRRPWACAPPSAESPWILHPQPLEVLSQHHSSSDVIGHLQVGRPLNTFAPHVGLLEASCSLVVVPRHDALQSLQYWGCNMLLLKPSGSCMCMECMSCIFRLACNRTLSHIAGPTNAMNPHRHWARSGSKPVVSDIM